LTASGGHRLQRPGLFASESQNAYSINNITAKKDGDGSATVRLGGCDGKPANCLPISPGGITSSALSPRPEILNGT